MEQITSMFSLLSIVFDNRSVVPYIVEKLEAVLFWILARPSNDSCCVVIFIEIGRSIWNFLERTIRVRRFLLSYRLIHQRKTFNKQSSNPKITNDAAITITRAIVVFFMSRTWWCDFQSSASSYLLFYIICQINSPGTTQFYAYKFKIEISIWITWKMFHWIDLLCLRP